MAYGVKYLAIVSFELSSRKTYDSLYGLTSSCGVDAVPFWSGDKPFFSFPMNGIIPKFGFKR